MNKQPIRLKYMPKVAFYSVLRFVFAILTITNVTFSKELPQRYLSQYNYFKSIGMLPVGEYCNGTFHGDTLVVVQDLIVMPEGLILLPGTTLFMSPGTQILLADSAKFICIGTKEKPVTIKLLPEEFQCPDPDIQLIYTSNDWEGIGARPYSTVTLINTKILGGDFGIMDSVIRIKAENFYMANKNDRFIFQIMDKGNYYYFESKDKQPLTFNVSFDDFNQILKPYSVQHEEQPTTKKSAVKWSRKKIVNRVSIGAIGVGIPLAIWSGIVFTSQRKDNAGAVTFPTSLAVCALASMSFFLTYDF